MSKARVAGALFLLAATPAAAQPVLLGGTVEGHVGVAVNPRLTTNRNDATGYGGVRLSPTLTQSTALSQTSLAVIYQREQYLRIYGHTQSVSATLTRSQTLSEYVKASVSAGYSRSNSLLLNSAVDPTFLDDFSNGRNTESIRGNGSVSWQISSRDSLDVGAFYQHQQTKSTTRDREFDQYGGNFSYLHTLSARTRVGLRMNASRYVNPDPLLPDSQSIAPALALQQVLSPVWKLDADVGISLQRVKEPYNTNTRGVSFHGSLCGTYPRSTICFTASRQLSASAFGGLRQQFMGSVDYNYKITELSSISLQATYLQSSSNRFNQGANSDVFRGDIEYNRSLNRRLSMGLQGRGAYRKSAIRGSAHSLSGSAFLRMKIGRLS